jgi:hypothetical protein
LELSLLGMCSAIIGTPYSSFSDIARQLSMARGYVPPASFYLAERDNKSQFPSEKASAVAADRSLRSTPSRKAERALEKSAKSQMQRHDAMLDETQVEADKDKSRSNRSQVSKKVARSVKDQQADAETEKAAACNGNHRKSKADRSSVDVSTRPLKKHGLHIHKVDPSSVSNGRNLSQVVLNLERSTRADSVQQSDAHPTSDSNSETVSVVSISLGDHGHTNGRHDGRKLDKSKSHKKKQHRDEEEEQELTELIA